MPRTAGTLCLNRGCDLGAGQAGRDIDEGVERTVSWEARLLKKMFLRLRD